MSLSRRHALALLAALPAACTSPNPALYTLAPVSGEAHTGAPRFVELRSPSLPQYLLRSEIVRSTEDFRVDVLPNDWWGESFSAMFNRVLTQDLTQRLPDSTVYSDTSAISASPGATIAVNVARFDANGANMELLEAEISISGAHAGSRYVRLGVPIQGAGTAQLVSAMSTALGRLADTIAAMLTGRSAATRPR